MLDNPRMFPVGMQIWTIWALISWNHNLNNDISTEFTWIKNFLFHAQVLVPCIGHTTDSIPEVVKLKNNNRKSSQYSVESKSSLWDHTELHLVNKEEVINMLPSVHQSKTGYHEVEGQTGFTLPILSTLTCQSSHTWFLLKHYLYMTTRQR